jgi:hypothetical protein
MNLNKWTIALAAAGVVSLASAVKAEEKPSTVMTALSSTTLSGYVDTSAQWNFGTGNARLPDYKFGGASKADGFNLDVVQIRIEKPLDEAEWAAGYRVDLWAGPDANILNTQSIFGSNSRASMGDFAVRQAYVALRMPVGNGIDWKVGVFDSIIGYESVESGNNPNYTRSFGHSIEPQTHTGVLASYRFSDLISASVGVANTVGSAINDRAQGPNGGTVDGLSNWTMAESYKTYMGSVAITAPDNLGFLTGSTLYAGMVSGFGDSYGQGQNSYYVGSTLATPVTGLRVGASFDYLDIHNLRGETWSVAGYASFQATEKLSLHLRGEYLRDRGDAKFFTFDSSSAASSTNPDRALAITATAQYDLWKNVLSRVEFRWDHSLSGQKTWGGTAPIDGETEGNRINEWLLAANLIYKF